MVRSSFLAGAEMMTFFTRALQVRRGGLGVGELAGGLDHDLRAQRAPVELRRVLDGEDLDRLAVDRDAVLFRLHRLRDRTEDGVVLQQVRQRLGVGQVVDRHELDRRVAERRPDDIASDAAEAVDCYLDCHKLSILLLSLGDGIENAKLQ